MKTTRIARATAIFTMTGLLAFGGAAAATPATASPVDDTVSQVVRFVSQPTAACGQCTAYGKALADAEAAGTITIEDAFDLLDEFLAALHS